MQPLAAETRFPGPDATGSGSAAGLCQPMSARFCARQLPGSARSTNFAPVATVPAARRTHLRPAAAAAKTASAPALGRRTSLSPSPVRARAAVEERAGLGGGVAALSRASPCQRGRSGHCGRVASGLDSQGRTRSLSPLLCALLQLRTCAGCAPGADWGRAGRRGRGRGRGGTRECGCV